MVYYEAWLKLSSGAGRSDDAFRTSDPFEADTPEAAIDLALDWMSRNVPDGREPEELWLHEGASKTQIFGR